MNGLIFSHLFRKNLSQLRNEEAFKFLEGIKETTKYCKRERFVPLFILFKTFQKIVCLQQKCIKQKTVITYPIL